jgi:hypothetical protein
MMAPHVEWRASSFAGARNQDVGGNYRADASILGMNRGPSSHQLEHPVLSERQQQLTPEQNANIQQKQHSRNLIHLNLVLLWIK